MNSFSNRSTPSALRPAATTVADSPAALDRRRLVMDRLRTVEDNLLVLVIATTALGRFVPAVGIALSGWVTPLLAALMLCVSLTFDLDTLRPVLARRGSRCWRPCWCTAR